ncbi:uncharacterized protein LOC111627686 [Centruroides sculpturatus]|uniref:uncharacterized protein LOC111627686 n=1 Tax=Centruroides sculpturatus TaxID=218467 RepID=UPI000C6CE87C|nr:uncharacterized protein LOC111627686 [Centruroides sculpturatus]XP_023227069.1 uncharacterized protein LOC111627686 [Centruroides sculpturatus]
MEEDIQMLVPVYESVLRKEQQNFNNEEISRAIRGIVKAYKKIHSNAPISIVDYNIGTYRFAYIYLYALCHTATVMKHLKILKEERFENFREMLKLGESSLNVCNLGGGPGCEVVGILSRIGESEVPGRVKCAILDMCLGWKKSLVYVMNAFVKSDLGKYYQSRLKCKFLEADLCNNLSSSAATTIEGADLVTMVKFISVVSYYYQDNSYYLQRIFQLMKPGSYLFFLDNSTGGFFEMVSEVAEENQFVLVFQCKTYHRQKQQMRFSTYKFGTKSLRSSSVIFAVWKKKESSMCACL